MRRSASRSPKARRRSSFNARKPCWKAYSEHASANWGPRRASPPGEYSAEIARVGGEENAYTTEDYTAFYATVALEHLPLALKLEADRMANLQITDAVVEPEREVIIEERRQRTDNDPAAQLGERLQAALFLNHPYRLPTIGWAHEMRGLTAADEDAFYRRWYAPDNAILVIA